MTPGWLLAACHTPSPDEALLRSLQDAVSSGATAASVAATVEPAATISTLRPDGREQLRLADIAPDPGLPPPPPDLHEVTTMYWVRPIEAADPRLVGIAWGSDGATLYYGVVSPP